MKRRIALVACCCALFGAAVRAQQLSFGRAITRAARPTIDDSPAARQQQDPPLLSRVAGEGAVHPLRPALVPARGTPLAGVESRSDLSLRPPVRGVSSLLAARVCFVEAETSLSDCAAITYVLRARARRSGWTFERMAHAYSALDADNDRARFARELPAGDVEEWSAATNAKWAAVRRIAARALAGHAANPCVGARHWGGPSLEPDSRRAAKAVGEGRWRRVQCNRPVLNAFFAEISRSTLSAAEAAPAGAKP